MSSGTPGDQAFRTNLAVAAPRFDMSEITAVAAATIAPDFICLHAVAAGAEARPYGLM